MDKFNLSDKKNHVVFGLTRRQLRLIDGVAKALAYSGFALVAVGLIQMVLG
jgi:hypothetical protein